MAWAWLKILDVSHVPEKRPTNRRHLPVELARRVQNSANLGVFSIRWFVLAAD